MIVGVVLCLCFSGLAFIVFNKYVNQNDVNYRKHRISVSTQIVESLKVPIWNLETQYIENISNAFLTDSAESIVAISIEDEEGHQLSFVKRDTSDKRGVFRAKEVTESYPVEYRGRLIGLIKVTFTNSPLVEDINKTFSFLGLWFSLTLLFTLFIVSLVCYYILIKPLNHFLSVIKSNAKGKYTIINEQFYLTELSIFASTLNYATNEVKLRDEKLKQYNDKLGERIAQKSKELYIQKERGLVSERLASLGQVAAGIAHEINNPLFIISGNLKRLRRELVKPSGKVIDLIDKLDNATLRISEIIRSMKALSRTDLIDEKIFVDIKELESIIRTICDGRLTEKDITLSFYYEEGYSIFVNRTQLYQIIVNLVNNSIDAVEKLKVRYIKIYFYNKDNKQIIDVIDSGNGISKEVAERMMDPFFTTKDVNKGTGLGLSLTHQMVKKNGGEIIYDESSKQTKFSIHFPLDNRESSNDE